MVSDNEPRYRLLDSGGTIVGTLYAKGDGTLALQETSSGSDNELTVETDGRVNAPEFALGDDNQVVLGANDDYAIVYDATDDRLEFRDLTNGTSAFIPRSGSGDLTDTGALQDAGTNNADGGDQYNLPQAEDSIDLQSAGDIENAASVDTEVVNSKHHYAFAYSGVDADARLDNALAAATDGDVIYLETATYSDNRTISNNVNITGDASTSGGGTSPDISGDWTWNSRGKLSGVSLISPASFTLAGINAVLENVGGSSSASITVTADACRLEGIVSTPVTFNAGTTGSIIDSSVDVVVTDNGTNTVGDIA